MSKFSAQQAMSLAAITDFLKSLEAKWEAQNPGGTSWWYINSLKLIKGTSFIISSLDDMIKFVENLFVDGKDKKTVVMLLANKLFDSVILTALPLWFKPFGKVLKTIMVDYFINYLVDFIVKQYNEGVWRTPETQETPTTPEV